jgi:hypothetical protein
LKNFERQRPNRPKHAQAKNSPRNNAWPLHVHQLEVLVLEVLLEVLPVRDQREEEFPRSSDRTDTKDH